MVPQHPFIGSNQCRGIFKISSTIKFNLFSQSSTYEFRNFTGKSPFPPGSGEDYIVGATRLIFIEYIRFDKIITEHL